MEECEHPIVLFYRSETAFKCFNCGEQCAKLSSFTEYELFCKLAGYDPNTLLHK